MGTSLKELVVHSTAVSVNTKRTNLSLFQYMWQVTLVVTCARRNKVRC